jgi:hypothetical protein
MSKKQTGEIRMNSKIAPGNANPKRSKRKFSIFDKKSLIRD